LPALASGKNGGAKRAASVCQKKSFGIVKGPQPLACFFRLPVDPAQRIARIGDDFFVLFAAREVKGRKAKSGYPVKKTGYFERPAAARNAPLFCAFFANGPPVPARKAGGRRPNPRFLQRCTSPGRIPRRTAEAAGQNVRNMSDSFQIRINLVTLSASSQPLNC
jgi:hypothetical protein